MKNMYIIAGLGLLVYVYTKQSKKQELPIDVGGVGVVPDFLLNPELSTSIAEDLSVKGSLPLPIVANGSRLEQPPFINDFFNS